RLAARLSTRGTDRRRCNCNSRNSRLKGAIEPGLPSISLLLAGSRGSVLRASPPEVYLSRLAERFGHHHCSESDITTVAKKTTFRAREKADHRMLVASTLIPFSTQSWPLWHLNNVPTAAMQSQLPRWVIFDAARR